MPHNGAARFSSLLFPLSKIPNPTSQPSFCRRGSPIPLPLAALGYFWGTAARLSHSAPRCFWGTEELSCSTTDSLGSSREPLTHSQVSPPPGSTGHGRGCGLNPSDQTPARGRADAAQPGPLGPSRDAFTAAKSLSRPRFGVSSLPAPPAERSQGAAVQGFRFRPISQKFCHHAVHHAHSRIRITQRMAPLQRLLKSVEKPSLATMGAGSGPVRSDRYHEVVLSWEYLVAPKFLLERDRAGGLQSGYSEESSQPCKRLSMSI